MDVIVTGATGYLGGHVVQGLLDHGHDVRALVRAGSDTSALERVGARCHPGDLLDERSLHRALRGAQGLVHCAARTGYWSRQDIQQRRINVEGTSTLLRVARRRGLERIVHVSSASAVGQRMDRTPLREEDPWVGMRGPRAMYIRSKRESEERVLAAARAGLPVTVVNPAVMLGPRANRPGVQGLMQKAARGRRWVPRGGSSVAAVVDVAEGCILALETGTVGERYLLGGHNLSWHELYTAVARWVGVAPPRGEYPDRLGRLLARGAEALDLVQLSRPRWAPELFRFWGWFTCADSGKAQRELGYQYRDLDKILELALPTRSVNLRGRRA